MDTIGVLTKIYRYSDIVYIGGAMGNTGLHNCLEPAAFGVPIIVGQHFKNFPEANQMINLGGMYSISNQKEFNFILNDLIINSNKRDQSAKANKEYVLKNRGAVVQIIDYIRI